MLHVNKQVFLESRIKKGLSMSALARLVDMSPSGIARIEKGGGVREKNAIKISQALEEDVFSLFKISKR